jgi:hypothetical protein
MSPNDKTLIVIFGGMAVMVVTTVCGAATGIALTIDDDPGQYALNWLASVFWGGVIGAVVGGLFWGLFGYMVCRNKNAAPNGVIPDDSTT